MKFNQTLSGARQNVERAFGNLKSRFRRLRDVLLHNHEDIYQLIVACCFLHNICVLNEDEIEEYSEEDDVDPNHFQNVYQKEMLASFCNL